MQSTRPVLSIILPNYNTAHAVLDKSLRSIEEQTFHNWECIIIDDSDHDEFSDYCRRRAAVDSRFIYIKPQEKLGLSRSLNLAIERARSDYIVRFDADDVCYPDRFEIQLKKMTENPQIGVCGGAIDIIDNAGIIKGERCYPIDHSSIERGFAFTSVIAHPATIIRKKLFETYGGYDEKFAFSEDLDLWLRFLNNGVKFGNCFEKIIQYREQDIYRSHAHWFYNIKARIKNFSSPYSFRKALGILVIIGVLFLPKGAQSFLMRLIRRETGGRV